MLIKKASENKSLMLQGENYLDIYLDISAVALVSIAVNLIAFGTSFSLEAILPDGSLDIIAPFTLFVRNATASFNSAMSLSLSCSFDLKRWFLH